MGRVVDIGTPEKVLLAGLGLVVLSLFLPWLTASDPVLLVEDDLQTTLTGAEAPDGRLAAGAAIVATALVLLDWRRRVTNGLAGVSAIVPVVIGVFYITEPTRGAEASSPAILETVTAGSGLYVAFLGGAVIFAGAVWSHRVQRRRTESRPGGDEETVVEGGPTGGQKGSATATGSGDGQRRDAGGSEAAPSADTRQPVADRRRQRVIENHRQRVEEEQEGGAAGRTRQPGAGADAADGTGIRVSPEWVYGVLGSLAMLVIMYTILGADPALSESEEALLGLILVGTWIAAPVTIYYDLRYVRARRSWQPRWWPWTLLAAVPFLHLLAVPVYLLLRRRNADAGGTSGRADDSAGPGHGPPRETDAKRSDSGRERSGTASDVERRRGEYGTSRPRDEDGGE